MGLSLEVSRSFSLLLKWLLVLILLFFGRFLGEFELAGVALDVEGLGGGGGGSDLLFLFFYLLLDLFLGVEGLFYLVREVF